VTLVSRETDAACIQREPDGLAPAWSALAAKRQPPSVFLTPEWIAVARAHQASLPITLAVGEPARGIAALAREADETITFAGGQLTDEQDVLAAPGDEAAVADAVARWVAGQRPPRVRLEYVPEERPTLAAFERALTEAGYRVARTRQTVSPVLDLPDDYDRYVQSLGKKARHELRRKVRRLEAAGVAGFRFAADGERAAVLDRFFALHRLSRGEKAGFMTAEVERFFRDAADALASVDRLRLGVLSFDDTDAAVLFGFSLGTVIALYNASYDPGLASLSVGIVSHAWAIREAIASGFRTYDLLRGDEPYKYDLGARDLWLARVDAERG
jgi:CelD/BcsL family acetyltransferase involved in cellulose biosynthesis